MLIRYDNETRFFRTSLQKSRTNMLPQNKNILKVKRELLHLNKGSNRYRTIRANKIEKSKKWQPCWTKEYKRARQKREKFVKLWTRCKNQRKSKRRIMRYIRLVRSVTFHICFFVCDQFLLLVTNTLKYQSYYQTFSKVRSCKHLKKNYFGKRIQF